MFSSALRYNNGSMNQEEKKMEKPGRMMSDRFIQNYLTWLREQERSSATIQKYRHNLASLTRWLDGAPLTKAALIDWKQHLVSSQAAATVNSMLVSANGFFRYMGWKELSVKPLKIQRNLFLEEKKELTKSEYIRLVHAAEKRGNRRLMLLLQTICATGNYLSSSEQIIP